MCGSNVDFRIRMSDMPRAHGQRTIAGTGAVAQLVERVVRNDEVRGSIPLSSTRNQENFL